MDGGVPDMATMAEYGAAVLQQQQQQHQHQHQQQRQAPYHLQHEPLPPHFMMPPSVYPPAQHMEAHPLQNTTHDAGYPTNLDESPASMDLSSSAPSEPPPPFLTSPDFPDTTGSEAADFDPSSAFPPTTASSTAAASSSQSSPSVSARAPSPIVHSHHKSGYITAEKLPSLEALARFGKVDAPAIQMSSQLEALFQYIREQDDDENVDPTYAELLQLHPNQLAQRVREMENLAYRLSLDEDKELQKASDLMIIHSNPRIK